jgi:hypothetical protein
VLRCRYATWNVPGMPTVEGWLPMSTRPPQMPDEPARPVQAGKPAEPADAAVPAPATAGCVQAGDCPCGAARARLYPGLGGSQHDRRAERMARPVAPVPPGPCRLPIRITGGGFGATAHPSAACRRPANHGSRIDTFCTDNRQRAHGGRPTLDARLTATPTV